MLAKKCFFVVIVTLFSLSLAMAQDPPAVHPKTGEELVMDVLRGTVTVDGDLSDWNLSAMTPAVLDTAEQLYSGQTTWDNPKDSSAEFYLLWDDVNIYVAVVMKDDKITSNKSGGDIWNADGIEVFFSTLNAVGGHEEHYQYGFDFKEQTWNWCNMDGAGQSAVTYVQAASSMTGDGYIVEASLEYGRMLSLDFSVGNTIGFHPVFDDTDIEDGDRELQMTWTGREAHDQSLGFGHIYLSDATAGDQPQARRPSPKDGDLNMETWANLSWLPGDFGVTHDVYFGDNYDAVNEGAEGTFVGNQADTFIIVGFPGFPFPDGLVPGTTYYWRIDEVNDAEPNSPWKGNIWSFSLPPKTAYFPVPDDGAASIGVDAQLTWTPGYGAKLHTVYFGETFDEVDSATGGSPQGTGTYNPGTLKMAKTYYWRVDEFDVVETHKGDVWSFTTEGAVGSPSPENGAEDVSQTPTLTWTPGVFADTHEVYFGADPAALELKASGGAGSESFEPGLLEWNTTYYWRVDEENNAEADSPWIGPLWSFTTANFLIIDDMEAYNDLNEDEEGSNRIYLAWIDGYENPAENGGVVGHFDPPFAEQSIVHSGNQSMPFAYDNAVGKSEATLTLAENRDWTIKGVDTLTIWYIGSSSNSAETMYVTLNGSATVDNEDPEAALKFTWTEWNIPLQAFADQGVNLSNVNSITLGLRSGIGGAGNLYFDDIRLYAPTP